MGRKIITPKCRECEQDTEIEFEGDEIQYPVIFCKHCGYIQNEWKKWWEVYSNRWKEREYWNNKKDMPSCLVGYFCYKYHQFYGVPYSFSLSNPIPYRGKEFMIARRIISMLDGNAYEAAKYIEWAFKKKVITRKKSITSMGFFSLPEIVNEYKIAKANSLILKRSSLLPEDYLLWCKKECADLFEKHNFKTWNDLNILVAFIKTYQLKEGNEYKVVNEAIKRNMIPVINNEIGFIKLED